MISRNQGYDRSSWLGIVGPLRQPTIPELSAARGSAPVPPHLLPDPAEEARRAQVEASLSPEGMCQKVHGEREKAVLEPPREEKPARPQKSEPPPKQYKRRRVDPFVSSFTIRHSVEWRDLLDQAAHIAGMAPGTFARDAVEWAARRVIAKQEQLEG